VKRSKQINGPVARLTCMKTSIARSRHAD